MATYEEYWPRAVLYHQGRLFKQHILNVEKPHLFWEDYHNLIRVYDDRKILLTK